MQKLSNIHLDLALPNLVEASKNNHQELKSHSISIHTDITIHEETLRNTRIPTLDQIILFNCTPALFPLVENSIRIVLSLHSSTSIGRLGIEIVTSHSPFLDAPNL